MDIQGDPQIFLWSGSTRTWRTGPWNGLRYSGIPEMQTYSMFTFAYVENQDEIYYSFNIGDPSIISRLIVNQTGSTQRFVWLNQTGSWNLFWFAPKDQCDSLSPCGPNGVCDPNNSPICDCLQGFVPKSPTNWALRDGTDGCVRKTELDCRNRTDGFVKVAEAKLPDTSSSIVNMTLSLDDCKAKCLLNCSCVAYASANISDGGTGCITWSTGLTDPCRLYTFAGQDLFVRLAAKDLVARRESISYGGHYNIDAERSRENNLDLPLFNLETIVEATDDFSMENKLGEGGFGPVYKGQLADGKEIAVKRLAKTSVQGSDEFKNEVMLIAKLQHRNLVQLIGCCIHGEERMLVYEYMPNRSLDAFLFDKSKGAFGYMSPEYAMDGIFSVKSDVFSFGVLVLEIISGKKNRGIYLSDPKLNLLGRAWSLWKDGIALELVNESLGFAFPMTDVLRCIKVGLLCVQERPEDRPTMSSVVLMLGSESATLPNPRQPGFVTTRVPLEMDSSSSKQDSVSINEISVTMFEVSQGLNTLMLGQSIGEGQTLVSANKIYELGFFIPAGSTKRYLGIWYHQLPVQTIVWVANRERPVSDSSGIFTIDTQGSLLIRDSKGTVLVLSSSTNTKGSNQTMAKLMDSGNFVLKPTNYSEDFLWQSFDHPTDTFLPGMVLGGQNQVITSWKSSDDPAAGDFSLGLGPNGTHQLLIRQRGQVTNSQNFSLVLEMATYFYNFSYVPLSGL
ncbi:hypothetical protein J5N97_011875 [Dioscorea zingiberensis]|uniref:non-specific serine/threonine protein kinase n=1 Tax=Dioscorea zingiberensis TaxID=325984 RepID=A0A9D5D3W9_9LILI|nr:hypothetical protein J5N97_011875 [Dioscorea zingiberensis]